MRRLASVAAAAVAVLKALGEQLGVAARDASVLPREDRAVAVATATRHATAIRRAVTAVTDSLARVTAAALQARSALRRMKGDGGDTAALARNTPPIDHVWPAGR